MTHRSIQAVSFNYLEHKFELNIRSLRAVMKKKDIENREIVAVSIAGASRKGKSFLLNFFLRYLNETVR